MRVLGVGGRPEEGPEGDIEDVDEGNEVDEGGGREKEVCFPFFVVFCECRGR